MAGELMVTIRAMAAVDVPAVQRLRDQAGWNQTDADWMRLLAWEPDGCWVAELGGRVVASTTVTTYGTRIAWVGMVLVDVESRRRGIGRRMLHHAEAHLEGRGLETFALDATPDGRPLYARLGYRDQHRLERWRGTVAEAVFPSGAAADSAMADGTTERSAPNATVTSAGIPDLRPMTFGDLAAVAGYDAAAFGTDRAHVLRALFAGHPPGCVVAERGGAVYGYALSRPGVRARHLGPLVADDAGTAEHLARAALARHVGDEAVMDVVAENRAAVALAGRLGLAPLRPFARMTRGAPPPTPDLGRLYTSASPEIG